MGSLKTWLAGWGIFLTYLLVCGMLDKQPAPESCVAEMKDGQGNLVQVSGKVAQVSVD